MRTALYARVSTYDQRPLSLQLTRCAIMSLSGGWKPALEVQDVDPGASLRLCREDLLNATADARSNRSFSCDALDFR